jgi:hypothetical protein
MILSLYRNLQDNSKTKNNTAYEQAAFYFTLLHLP